MRRESRFCIPSRDIADCSERARQAVLYEDLFQLLPDDICALTCNEDCRTQEVVFRLRHRQLPTVNGHLSMSPGDVP